MLIPYKDDNPSETTAFVTVGIIVLNVLAFILQLAIGIDETCARFGATPAVIVGRAESGSGGRPGPGDLSPAGRAAPARAPAEESVPIGLALLTLFTSMFLHGGIDHILGNMLFLWIFGNNVEDAMGHVRFLAFYVLTGLLAAMSHVVIYASSTIPVVGASGAISGVLGAYVYLYPHARVRTLLILYVISRIDLPAWAFIGIFFGFNVLLWAVGRPGVAWAAHIFGFVAGFGLLFAFVRQDVLRRRRRGPLVNYERNDWRPLE